MNTYTCPKCKITIQTEENLVKKDEENIAINLKREEINRQIDEENKKIEEEFAKEMERVRKECINSKKVSELKVFAGNKDGYDILKVQTFQTIERVYPQTKSHALYLPTQYIECPNCHHKESI